MCLHVGILSRVIDKHILIACGYLLVESTINLFTLRDLEERHTRSEVLELCADAGYDGAEFLHCFPEADLETVKRTRDSTGLAVPSAHLGSFISLDEQPAELEQTSEA